ncbi:MAG: hypothetical protein OSA95_04225 [Opitutales bacterium]|nr:hypothetical protein [Opitutales bacterium]
MLIIINELALVTNGDIIMLDNIVVWVKKLTEAGIAIIALAVVIQVIFPAGDPEKGTAFIGTDVVGTITGIVGDLGEQGLVGLAAVAVIYAIFTRKTK